ncbi:glycosyltransferase [Pengzhenrongella frigida]|uniref:Glycosyltransferase family 2 protein n=1 Tax=Pengzhenrongella frigida TaxID=1259133 RepID=A0A4Q5MZU9_9MICO|nr:glycosyltransferase [Cellulomonas sp. HLT2-17]RYV51392.1 glycosyltransferase family 2 protein [Cellulomonas sp. HLT2-17]
MTDSPLTLLAPARAVAPTGPPVTVVVVTRGVTRYLGETLASLAAQTRVPAHVVVVDALRRSSAVPDDDVARLAARTLAPLGTHLRVVAAPGARTFGHAVRSALEQLATGAVDHDGPTGWLWLLHDDSAPEPAALDELVRAVEHSPSVAVAGVKQRSWTDPALLLELGVTTSRLGRRMTGIEIGEVDQGQHDGRDDVFGVGLAGALVRREVWDALGGTDPRLGPFGDGLDLSRRARLAGHRVIVVPSAAVRHAQASYNGLREADVGPDGDPLPDGDPSADSAAPADVRPADTRPADTRPADTRPADTRPAAAHAEPDPRRSFGARRRAYVHARLAAAPVLLLPFLGIGYLLAGAFRAVVRLLTKDPVLALAEIAAPVAALLHPGRMARARGITRRAEVATRRSLRPLQNTWRDVAREQRDGHLARVELRRVGWAPSELELSELAALASKRRFGLAALGVVLIGLTAAVLGGLVGGVLGGGSLVGGALLPAQESLGELWRAATSGWVADGLGTSGPADAFLVALLPFTALTGATAVGAVDLLFLGGLVLAGLGAWFAAGAATRSVGVRLWAAIVWVAAPSLTLALDGGRVGAVVAHLALPWVALGIARALGVQRQDVVLSGLVGARRVGEEADGAPGASAPPIARGAHAGRSTRVASASLDALPTASPGSLTARVPSSSRTAQGEADAVARTTSLIAPATGSIGAAAAAGLAFALAVAGAPVLLPFGLLALLAVAAMAPRRRGRLALVALPALAVAGPSIAQVVTRAGNGGWRLLLADPGVPVPSSAAPVWQQLLSWPVSPPTAVLDRLPEPVAGIAPFVLGGVVALLAVLALVRGATVARGVRAGWLVAACGLTAAIASGRVETAAGVDVVVRGWTGPGVSLVLLGLLTAAVLGTGGLNDRMAGYAFGWRQIGAVVLTTVAVLAPVVPLAEWTVRARTADVGAPGAFQVVSRDGFVVPAVGQQSQTSPDRSRVLALAADPAGGVAHQLLRGDGPQLTETATAVDARALSGAPGSPVLAPADPADEILADLVARLSAAAAGNVSAELGDLGVAAVLVPPALSADVEAARSVLVGRLDATAGLERITENSTGVIWRVVVSTGDPAAAAGAAWARVVEPALDGVAATALEALPLAVDTRLAAGDTGRQIVLAERADPGWHAWLDGRPLRSVTADWRQTFALGADGGRLTVGYSAPDRTPWLVLQGAVLLFTVVVAVPGRRRRGGTR